MKTSIRPTLYAYGFILVSSIPYTCFCSLKQMKMVKHNRKRFWPGSKEALCSPRVLQSRALFSGCAASGPSVQTYGPESGAQETPFVTRPPDDSGSLRVSPVTGLVPAPAKWEKRDLCSLIKPLPPSHVQMDTQE